MMGYDEDEDFDEINVAHAAMIAGGFDITEEALKKGLTPEQIQYQQM